MLRIGSGFDVHKLITLEEYLKIYPERKNTKFTLAGVDFAESDLYDSKNKIQNSPFRLLGHSDADVALHAVCDALLGALALGDIGDHFPDSDFKYAGIDSRSLLKKCYGLVETKGYSLVNLDLCILAQRPIISPYKAAMRSKLAELLKTDLSNISVKATSTEKLGFVGRKEGIAAQAHLLIQKDT